jgi:hypothetical protein
MGGGDRCCEAAYSGEDGVILFTYKYVYYNDRCCKHLARESSIGFHSYVTIYPSLYVQAATTPGVRPIPAIILALEQNNQQSPHPSSQNLCHLYHLNTCAVYCLRVMSKHTLVNTCRTSAQLFKILKSEDHTASPPVKVCPTHDIVFAVLSIKFYTYFYI